MRRKIIFLLFVVVAFGESCTDQSFNDDKSSKQTGLTTRGNSISVSPLSDCTDPPPCYCAGSNYYCDCSGQCLIISQPVVCEDCNSRVLSGNYSTINSYHQYPRQTINVCNQTNHLISLYCEALDIPNRFTVYDANGTYITTTGWFGNAPYPGPWGSSLLTDYNTTTITFPYTTSSYQILVETETPPNYGYSPNEDYWSVSVGCD